MAAGNFLILDIAKPKIGNGVFDLDGHTFKMALCDNSQALDETFTGASGDGRYADLTGEVSGAGYTAGGEALTGVTWAGGSGTVTFDADPTTWEAATFVAKYAVIYDDTDANKSIVGVVDLEETDPAGRSSAGGDFTVQWPTGIFTAT